MTKYIVKKGKHFSSPIVSLIPKKIGKIVWKIQLGDGIEYSLEKNRRQWNKLAGITFDPIKRNRDSILLAWRYVNGKHELCPYFNVDSKNIMPETDSSIPIWEINSSKPVFLNINLDKGIVKMRLDQDNQVFTYRYVHRRTKCISFEVGFYFGGSEAAPNDISVYKKRL